jgi:hypothetical protein
MDTRAADREVIEKVLTDYAAIPWSHGEFTSQIIFDTERDHYLIMLVGRDGERRVHGALVHVDIEGSQIVIQRDGTEHGIAPKLARAGIPKDRIVLAFHPDGPFLYSEADEAA